LVWTGGFLLFEDIEQVVRALMWGGKVDSEGGGISL
jgi:hypothetical protein